MSFDWSQYRDLAQELVGQTKSASSGEAKQRAAISRAYYAAFCKARNFLRDKEKGHAPASFRTGRVHGYVQDQFIHHPNIKRKRLASTYNDCAWIGTKPTIVTR